MTERFLLTGALGCIGSWVAYNLVKEGKPPVILDIGGEPKRLKQLMSDAELAQITFVNGDVTDLATVERTLDDHGITNIIHLAALQVPFCRPIRRSVPMLMSSAPSTCSRRPIDARTASTKLSMPRRWRSMMRLTAMPVAT